MERSRLLVTVPAEQGLRQATGSLIMTLGRKENTMRIVTLMLFASTITLASWATTPEAGSSEKFSVDFPNEEIRKVIRNIADVHELNVVIPDSLSGTTSLKLRDVTWEQAFDVLLKPIGWHHEVDGDIILIKRSEAKSEGPSVITEVDMLSHVAGLQSTMLKSTLRDKDYADSIATFYRNLYLALIDKGFSKEEALKIVISSSISPE